MEAFFRLCDFINPFEARLGTIATNPEGSAQKFSSESLFPLSKLAKTINLKRSYLT
jgi:hypothetical protein